MFIQGAGRAEQTYDAIVVGSGISGGWAAKELTEKGLRTLVLERGRDVKHPDYPTATKESWEFAGRNRLSPADIAKQEKQNRTGYTTHPASAHWFVNDVENPYSEVKRFDWMRGYHVGGRSLLWGRQSYRFSELDWEANARDGVAVDWPIRSADMSPVVRLRRALRGDQRQPRGPAATARRPVPAADGDELPREAGEGPHRQERSTAVR